MTIKQAIIACLLSAIVSAAFTQYYFPKIQTKTVETTKEVVRTDVQTVIKTVTHPGGDTESTTTIIDHTQRIETAKKTDVTITKKDWLVAASYSTSIHTLEPIYGVQVNRRILGPAYIGALLNNKGEVGLSIGLEF